MKRFGIQRPPPIKTNEEQDLFQWRDSVAAFSRKITTAKTITAAYTVETEVYWIRVDCTSGAITVTLPPVGDVGRPIGVIKVDSSGNAVTVDGNGSETINGATTKSLASQYDCIVIRDNGTSWDLEQNQFALGTIATQAANNVTITGGSITGITDLAIADGGTGASTASAARTNLDVPSNSEAILDTIIAAKGDLIVGTADNTPSILTVGSDDFVLTADAAQPTGMKWAAGGGGGDLDSLTDVVITTPGDGQVLTYDSGTSKWVNESSAAGFSNPMTTAGDIIIGDTGGAAIRLAAGSDGKVLKLSSGSPTWDDDIGIPATLIDAKGDLIAGSAADTAAKVSVGTNGYALVADSGATPGVAWKKRVVVQELPTLYSTKENYTNKLIPFDNSIPQNTEGQATGLTASITPTDAANIITAHALVNVSATTVNNAMATLVKDSDSNTVAVGWCQIPAANAVGQISLYYKFVAGGTSAITFTVNIGTSLNGVITLNGQNSGALFGGAMNSTLLLKEIVA